MSRQRGVRVVGDQRWIKLKTGRLSVFDLFCFLKPTSISNAKRMLRTPTSGKVNEFSVYTKKNHLLDVLKTSPPRPVETSPPGPPSGLISVSGEDPCQSHLPSLLNQDFSPHSRPLPLLLQLSDSNPLSNRGYLPVPPSSPSVRVRSEC